MIRAYSSRFKLKPRLRRWNTRLLASQRHELQRSLRDSYCFSSPRLKSVHAATVFFQVFQGQGPPCVSILFKYENGAKQAVRQCHLGFNNYKQYANPSSLCYITAAACSVPPHRFKRAQPGHVVNLSFRTNRSPYTGSGCYHPISRILYF